MIQRQQVELIQDEIRALLSEFDSVPDLSGLIEKSLIDAGPMLSNGGSTGRRWLLLPLMVCEAISGQYQTALPLTAAIQIFKAAAELLDDIEDQDSPEALYKNWDLPVAVNVATTLVVLAEKTMISLKSRGVPDRKIIRIADAINSSYIVSCIGQHRDITQAPGVLISEDEYLNLISLKSAAQIECACYAGALLATNTPKMLKSFAAFGHNLGMAVQISNDIQGIIGGVDITRRKITLPVIFALTQAKGMALNELSNVYNIRYDGIPDVPNLRRIFFDVGAMHYSSVKLECYRQAAGDALAQAKSLGANTRHLKELLEL